MIPEHFEYTRASSVDEALHLLQQHGDKAKLLAGGHSLIPVMKLRLNAPGVLIDIRRIDALTQISESGGNVVIGACATHAQVAGSALVQAKAPLLAAAAAAIGDVQVRNMGTLGGSLAHADPAADYPAAVLASEATIMVQGPGGAREIAAGDFFTDLFTTALAPDEIITEVHIPAAPAGAGASYQKFAQPASRFALAGCAALVARDNGNIADARVALTGIANHAYRATQVEAALNGKPADAATIEAAAEHAADGQSVLSDHFASADYRKHLAAVQAKRALLAACGLA